MTKRDKYPRIGDSTQCHGHKLCDHCNEEAVRYVRVQESYMRGEDEVYKLCERGVELAEGERWRVLFSAIENTKNARREAHAN